MAVAAAEVAGSAAEGAGAAEGMSSEASQAVSAAKAGHGRRLSPEVADELRRRASRKPKVAPSSAKSSGGGGVSLPRPGGALRAASRAAGAVSTRQGRSSLGVRVVLAFGAFLVALELASYLSGRYFSYSLSGGAQKVGNAAGAAAGALELYPGQAQSLALRKVLPSA